MNKMEIDNENKIDEVLYSRSLYVMGHEAQKRIQASSVLIVGLNGLGIETSKNIVLAGCRSVTLYDNKLTKFEDLSSQFYLNEDDIGKSRAIVSAPKLSELNPYVNVSVLDVPEFNVENLSKHNFTVIVLIDQSLTLQLEISEYCHNNNIQFLVGDVKGVFGSIFCDFGRDFQINDINGEPALTSMIASITNDTNAIITTLEDTRHCLSNGDKIKLTDIVGMEELNGKEFNVTVIDPFSFSIDCNTSTFNAYSSNGNVTEVKQSTKISFDSMIQSYENPGNFCGDAWKVELIAPILHLCFRGLLLYQKQYNNQPMPGNMDDAQVFYDMLVDINDKASQEANHFKLDKNNLKNNETMIKRFALCCQGNLSPICALLGGILGQEILKACSGKFMPIKQWFYYDAMDTLPIDPLPIEEVTPINCRYDGQIMVYGKTIQEKLSKLNMFLVGAGAIGCEMIKNWALMGISCHANFNSNNEGTTHITDMDHIEKSNLSRQFLFRNSDIGQQKSSTAARAAKSINASFNLIAYENKVAPETESIFNDDFFESLDMVCTALDNVDARLYIDQRCLFYHKPMLESGTLGTKGHTQIIVPGFTEHYGASRDPPEKLIPICTIKSFPTRIEHTLQWAREWFEPVFNEIPSDCNKYITSDDYNVVMNSQSDNIKLEVLNQIHDALGVSKPNNYEDCVVWTRKLFQDLFCNNIKQLLFNFPLDKVNSSGTLFWSGAKKAPSALEFDVNDPLHLEFIHSVSNMRAIMYGIAPHKDTSVCWTVAPTVICEEFTPRDGVKIAQNEAESKEQAANADIPLANYDQQCQSILSQLPSKQEVGSLRLIPADFDKDVDDHMRCVAAVSNLRARNYKIGEADLHKSRGIAGNIIPAIATTTALVTGIICLEVYKLVQNMPFEKYSCSTNNLALPSFCNNEPNPPKFVTSVIKGVEWKWSPWDRIDINRPDITLSGLLELLEEEFNLDVSMLSSGVSILFSTYGNKKKMEERKMMKLKDIVESVAKSIIPASQKYLIFEVSL